MKMLVIKQQTQYVNESNSKQQIPTNKCNDTKWLMNECFPDIKKFDVFPALNNIQKPNH
jgi:hypothetical protein